MKYRSCPSMAIAVIGTHGRIGFAGDAARYLDIWTVNPHGSGPTNVRDTARAPATQGG